MSRVAAVCLGLLAFSAWLFPARADDGAQFINSFSGEWLGTGQLLFGPQFGTKFHCELDGRAEHDGLTFAMQGRCWMGSLSGAVHAKLRYSREMNRFHGEFMDGGDGQGADIIGLREDGGFRLRLSQGETQGSLTAEPVNSDQIKIRLLIRDKVNNRDFPVVAMGFTRKQASALGLPDYMPEPHGPVTTGSVRGAAR